MPRVTTEEAYEARVIRQVGCWGWSGALSDGYGVVPLGLSFRYAHRFSYSVHRGPIPDGMDVMHRCHNPVCSNPEHLKLGTRAQNMQMSQAVGRLQRKIPLEAMPEIRARRAAGETLQQIGDYGCTKQAVRHMLNRSASCPA